MLYHKTFHTISIQWLIQTPKAWAIFVMSMQHSVTHFWNALIRAVLPVNLWNREVTSIPYDRHCLILSKTFLPYAGQGRYARGTVALQSVSESKVNNCKIMIMWHFSFLNLYFVFSFPNQTVKEDLNACPSLTKLSVSTHLLLTSEINCTISQCIYKHVAEQQS